MEKPDPGLLAVNVDLAYRNAQARIKSIRKTQTQAFDALLLLQEQLRKQGQVQSAARVSMLASLVTMGGRQSAVIGCLLDSLADETREDD